MDPASLYSVKAILVLDNDGKRLISKYYDNITFPSKENQLNFESKLYEKTNRSDAEILLFENFTIVFKSNVDLMFFVIGSCDENELILSQVLECLYDCVSDILRKNIEKSELLAEYSTVLLAIDNMIDKGVILETDCDEVLDTLPGRYSGSGSSAMNALASGKNLKNISEMTTGQLFQSAKNLIKSAQGGV